jgi:MoaA/NifB/PqqE/SkfB family radical SAM enzyme
MESNHLDLESVTKKLATRDFKIPEKIQVDPEGACTHQCIMCSYRSAGWVDMEYYTPEWFDGKREHVVPGKSGLTLDVMLRLCESIKNMGIKETEITGGGEPMIYPYIDQMLDSLKDSSTLINLVTNGTHLRKLTPYVGKNFSWLRVSVNAADPETYRKVHRVNTFDMVMHDIEKFKWQFPQVKTYISYCVLPENMEEIVAATVRAKEIGLDGIKFNAVYTPSGDGMLTEPQAEQVKGYLQRAEQMQDSGFVVKNSFWKRDKFGPNDSFNQCNFANFMVAVGYNGKVYPCCIVKNRTGYEYGDLNKQSLEEIFTGRREYYASTCPVCWLKDLNIQLEQMREGK